MNEKKDKMRTMLLDVETDAFRAVLRIAKMGNPPGYIMRYRNLENRSNRYIEISYTHMGNMGMLASGVRILQVLPLSISESRGRLQMYRWGPEPAFE